MHDYGERQLHSSGSSGGAASPFTGGSPACSLAHGAEGRCVLGTSTSAAYCMPGTEVDGGEGASEGRCRALPAWCRAGCAAPASRSSLRSRNAPRAVGVAAAASPVPGDFSIPAAPILIPEGPWKAVDGCVCAPKGFKAQGAGRCSC